MFYHFRTYAMTKKKYCFCFICAPELSAVLDNCSIDSHDFSFDTTRYVLCRIWCLYAGCYRSFGWMCRWYIKITVMDSNFFSSSLHLRCTLSIERQSFRFVNAFCVARSPVTFSSQLINFTLFFSFYYYNQFAHYQYRIHPQRVMQTIVLPKTKTTSLSNVTPNGFLQPVFCYKFYGLAI